MKIAFLSFYGGIVARGAETFVHELANTLTDLGNDVVVYQGGDRLHNSRYKSVILNIDVDWSREKSATPFLNYYSLQVKEFTVKVLKQIDSNTEIIFPVNGQWQSLLCSFWAKKNNKKIIISGQSGPGLDDRINILTFPNAFVGLTKFQSDWAKKVNPLVKFETIPNGVDLITFKGLPLQGVKNTILSVGAFVKEKRHHLTIEAVSKLKNVKLKIVGGGGDLKNEIERLGVNELGKDRFEILSVDHKKMPEIYKKANVLAFPTVPWESFGIVMVEAMASGLPVVASNDPIRREIVGDAGILVDPTNTEKYAKALQKALDTKWGDTPRRQAEKFSWDDIAKQYDELFKTLRNKN